MALPSTDDVDGLKPGVNRPFWVDAVALSQANQGDDRTFPN